MQTSNNRIKQGLQMSLFAELKWNLSMNSRFTQNPRLTWADKTRGVGKSADASTS